MTVDARAAAVLATLCCAPALCARRCLAASLASTTPSASTACIRSVRHKPEEVEMSQHTIPSNDESRFTVVVGYDRPLDWFFGTVYNATAPTVENEDVVADL